MSKDISIAVSARDNFSHVVTTMRNAGVHFNKNLEEMQAQLNAINKTRATLKLDTKTAENNLKAIQKEYLKAKEAGDGMVSKELLERLDEANEAYEQARFNLRELNKAANETEKSMERAGGVFKKVENSIGGSSGSLMQQLGQAGLWKLAGDAASSLLSQRMYSALGTPAGDIVGSTASGIASGVALGSIAGPHGMVVGGIVGGASGLVNGFTQVESGKDDAFKSAVQEQYSAISERRSSELLTGTSIAAQRELDKIAFDKLLKTDSTETLAGIRNMANSTPFLYEDLKSITKTLATYGYSPDEMENRLTQIGDTGAALGMSTSDMQMVATGLGRMNSSGKTTLEYLNLLTDRGIPAIDYLAEAMGVANSEVYDMVSKGLIPGAQAAEVIANSMGEANSGAMEAMSKTFSGLTSTKEGLEQELQNAMGAGFIEARKSGLEAHNAFLDPESETGQKMGEAYRLIGVYKADLENQREQAFRDAMTAAMESDEYIAAAREENGVKMGEILAQAEIDAETAYRNSEGYQAYEDSEKNIVGRLQVALADDWQHFGYEMGLEFTKGRASAVNTYLEQERERLMGQRRTESEGALGSGTEGFDYSFNYGMSEAFGMPYVPYNNFPANLHEGERVLTAAEAREYSSGSGGVNVTVQGLTVREEADVEKVAREIVRQMRLAQMVS